MLYMSERKDKSIVKFPYGYYFRKCDVLLMLRERKKALKSNKKLLKEIEYLQKKIRYKKGLIDLSSDNIAKRWLNVCRFWLRPLSRKELQ